MVVSNIFYFQPYLQEWSNLTNIFQGGWNHQLVSVSVTCRSKDTSHTYIIRLPFPSAEFGQDVQPKRWMDQGEKHQCLVLPRWWVRRTYGLEFPLFGTTYLQGFLVIRIEFSQGADSKSASSCWRIVGWGEFWNLGGIDSVYCLDLT